MLPRFVREWMKLNPCRRVQAILYEDRIELVPLRAERELRGTLRGFSTDLLRVEDRL